MEDISDDDDLDPVQAAETLLDRVDIQQGLAWMGMKAVTRVDNRQVGMPRYQVGGPGHRVP